MTKEQLKQATLQIFIANLQDPNTTPSFDNYSENDIKDAAIMAAEVADVCNKYFGV